GLLDHAEDRDALRRREGVRIAPDLELCANAGALGERIDLAVEDLAERAADHALRLQRVRDLPELTIELDEARGQIVEAAVCLLAEVFEDERVDLLLQELDVRREREDVLDRSIVQVEAQSHEASLGRRGQGAIAVRRVLEEVLALDHGAQSRGDLRQI